MKRTGAAFCALCTAMFGLGTAQESAPCDSLLSWMERQIPLRASELRERSPYPVLRYGVRIDDAETWTFSADRGSPVNDFPQRNRTLFVALLLGTPEFASARPLQWQAIPPEVRGDAVELPLHFSEAHYSRALQQATEWSFRQTRDHFAQLLSERATMIEEEPAGLDWAPAKQSSARETSPRMASDSANIPALKRQILALSKRWRGKSWLHGAGIELSWRAQHSRMAFSDSPAAEWTSEIADLSVTFLSRADNGLDLMEHKTWSFSTLPAEIDTGAIGTTIDSLLTNLEHLRRAPMGEPYAGPVLLEGSAAAVFVHEVLGHRLESHRLRQRSDGQTFLRKRNERIAPQEVSLIDDPTLTHWEGIPLHGHYKIDDQGTPAQPARLIEHGVLVGLLNGRATAWIDDSSNGHGRGRPALSRMGNTVLTHSAPISREALRARLLQAAQERGIPYGLIIKDLQGGYTITGRELPQSFQLLALSAVRVWVDGRPDELIRGVNLSGSPLSALSHLIGASDRTAVFNGFCGAENGWVPVSSVSPDLLFSTLEGEIQQTRSGLLPILPPPPEDQK